MSNITKEVVAGVILLVIVSLIALPILGSGLILLFVTLMGK